MPHTSKFERDFGEHHYKSLVVTPGAIGVSELNDTHGMKVILSRMVFTRQKSVDRDKSERQTKKIAF